MLSLVLALEELAEVVDFSGESGDRDLGLDDARTKVVICASWLGRDYLTVLFLLIH